MKSIGNIYFAHPGLKTIQFICFVHRSIWKISLH